MISVKGRGRVKQIYAALRFNPKDVERKGFTSLNPLNYSLLFSPAHIAKFLLFSALHGEIEELHRPICSANIGFQAKLRIAADKLGRKRKWLEHLIRLKSGAMLVVEGKAANDEKAKAERAALYGNGSGLSANTAASRDGYRRWSAHRSEPVSIISDGVN